MKEGNTDSISKDLGGCLVIKEIPNPHASKEASS